MRELIYIMTIILKNLHIFLSIVNQTIIEKIEYSSRLQKEVIDLSLTLEIMLASNKIWLKIADETQPFNCLNDSFLQKNLYPFDLIQGF